MDIITRGEWGARSPRSRSTTSWSARRELVVHYSEGPTDQSVRSIQNFHMDGRGWSDVGYNFLVDVKGRIYEGRGWLVTGAHAEGHNTSGIGVCFIGRDGDATDAAKRSIRWLYDQACKKAGRDLLKRGHGQLSGNSTSCPGKQLLSWVKAGMPSPGGSKPKPPADPDYWDVQSSKAGRRVRVPWATPLLLEGSSGSRVEWLQDALKGLGHGLVVDGRFGPATERELKEFQSKHRDENGDQLDDDGVYGHHTARGLYLAHGGKKEDAV